MKLCEYCFGKNDNCQGCNNRFVKYAYVHYQFVAVDEIWLFRNWRDWDDAELDSKENEDLLEDDRGDDHDQHDIQS